MMQRWVSKLRPFLTSSHRALLHTTPHSHPPLPLPVNTSIFNPLFSTQTKPQCLGFQSLTLLSLNQQIRFITTKERRMKRLTPIVSKVKKYKIKGYSSFKSRFKPLNDGTIRRWHAGKRHNAHLKSKISKRRLRLPALVHPAYAKVMKKLNFFA